MEAKSTLVKRCPQLFPCDFTPETFFFAKVLRKLYIDEELPLGAL
jgi:hypothetical protein